VASHALTTATSTGPSSDLLDRKRRDVSLVDAVSFVVMRQRRLEHAFAFDPHFEDEGFSLLR
jgi:predicted nucleic acid-binding protein